MKIFLAILISLSGIYANEVLIPSLKGIHLVGSETENPKRRTNWDCEIEATDINLTQKQFVKLCRNLQRFCKKEITEKQLKKVQNVISKFYQSIGRPLVVINVPEQDITEGLIVVDVIESHLSAVKVDGKSRLGDKKLEDSIRQKRDAPLDTRTLINDISWLNRNPFRQVNALYSPGDLPNSTNIELLVKEDKPFRVYTGTDNLGFKETDRKRLFGGVTWDLFNTNHILSYQYTASYDFSKYQAHTLHYTAPLPWRHIIDLFGGLSYVDVKKVLMNNFRSRGQSYQASGRYIIPLTSFPSFLHEVMAGIDWKRTNTDVTFGESDIINKNVNVFQFMLEYNLEYNPSFGRTYLQLQAFYSPGQWLDDMSNTRYNLLRPKAINQYFYVRGILQQTYRFASDVILEGIFQAQLANQNLLPSEQYGLGGYNSVRGFDQRQINVDNAALLSVQVFSPAFSLIGRYSEKKSLKDRMRFLAFIDSGWGWQHKFVQNEGTSFTLVGIGPGVRYTMNEWLSSRFDWGIQLVNDGLTEGFHQRIDFSVVLIY